MKNRVFLLSFIFFVTLATGGCATQAHTMTRSLGEGNAAALRGDFADAVTAYERALEAVPDSRPARRNLGIVLVKVGDYRRARELMTAVLPYYPADLDLQYHLGEANRGLADYGAAVQCYNAALGIDAQDLRALKALAWTYYKQKNYAKSLDVIKSKYDKNPQDLQLILIVASAYNKLGLYEKALGVLHPVEEVGFRVQSKDKVSADSEKALLLATAGDAYLGIQRCEKADKLYAEVLRNRPFMAQALVGSAKCDLKARLPERARVKLERSLRAEPDVAEPHLLLSQIYERSKPQRSAFYYKRYMLLSSGKATRASDY